MPNIHPHVLRDYALIADGERGAVVSPRGDIVWLCAPRWDCDAVFSTLIGGEGVYAVTPAHTFVWGGYYEEGTLIWRSRWITVSGLTECREALGFPGERDRVVLLRRIIARDCPAEVEVVLDLRAGFGKHGLRSVKRDDRGAWTGRAGDLHVRWSGEVSGARVRRAGGASVLAMNLTVPAGQSRDLVLEVSAEPLRDAPADPARLWRTTEERWADAVPPLDDVVAPRDARQAQVVLRGLTSSGGGMVAAATTSLPERAEQGRDYDYRYAWIRDQVYAGRAAAAAGAFSLLDDAVAFISARLHEDGPKLVPAYAVGGGRVPDQRDLDLPGYPGGYDLVGNWVNKQFQLDALGESLLLLAAAGSHDRLDSDSRKAAEIAADASGYAQVEEAARQTEEFFGPIDVWVNVAFTSVFSPFAEITPDEFLRVTEVSYLGFVHGTMVALARMRPRGYGTIVQVGSALGARSIPLQSAYCGAKHAINGFTSSLRCELLHEHSGVHITVAQMPAVNTPQFSWVRSRLPRHPQPVPPIYQPEVAARGVLFAADHPQRRQYWVGASTAATIFANKFVPALLDRYLARTDFDSQQTSEKVDADRPDNLYEALDGQGGRDHRAHGIFDPRSHARSAQVWLDEHTAGLAGLAAGAAVATGVVAGQRAWRRGRR